MGIEWRIVLSMEGGRGLCHPGPNCPAGMERERRGVSGVLSSLSLLCVILDLQLDGALATSQAEIESHLEMGRKLLAAGQLAEALSHYHSAVDGDPKNYLTYYKRATVYLAMGKFKSALPDLSKAIELKPDFLAARLQRGNILLKQGDTQDAEEDFRAVLLSSPTNEEAKKQLDRVREVEERHEEAWAAYDREDYGEAISLLEKVIEFCPWDPSVRELRSECYLRIGELSKAIQDLKPTTKLRNDNRAAFLKLSRLYYTMGEHEESLSQVRECLKLDQDDKDCFSHYKQVKKLSRQLESAEELIRDHRYESAIEKFEAAIKTEPNVEIYRKEAKERICHCLSKSQHTEAAIKTCTESHQRDPHNPQVLKDRAEAYILNEEYEKAVEDFQQAKELDGENEEIKEGLERSQKLLKQSRKRDYYKILGVKRNANKQEVIKAYRKLAQQWHPDNFQSEEEKREAEKKFIDIAAAKEVLTDPEMRQKVDAGEDPLDPENQQGSGHHQQWPFEFNPFSSGNFHFKFNYN
ncbi:dnaJ homolog subfamily C member 3-like isoform X2 [Rana temporaria]|uniref:dnaJ homolog subfamily C member 3-like isoform X2 n=1 Tax=Rana temporaria TaxID=8407 RepID=UPI001AAD7D2B|nr:dnaJ homolog subfamily C member 3-like isoform X2 [Rana temporaria]